MASERRRTRSDSAGAKAPLAALSLLAMALLAPGCGTSFHLRYGDEPRPFGGVRATWRFITYEPHWKVKPVVYPLRPFAVLDLPLSLVADLVLLPAVLLVQDDTEREAVEPGPARPTRIDPGEAGG